MKDNKDRNLEKIEHRVAEPVRNEKVYAPLADIYEKDDAILIRLDMPGVDQQHVDIRLENTELEISGIQQVNVPEGYEALTGEYGTGTFRRKFAVPQLIDREKIKARLANGVLDIELPKAEQAKPRKIEISTGN